MDQKFLPAILMTLLSIACLAVILRGLKLALRRNGWEASEQQNIFTQPLSV